MNIILIIFFMILIPCVIYEKIDQEIIDKKMEEDNEAINNKFDIPKQ